MKIFENWSTWKSISSIVDCRLSNFEMKCFQNIAKPSEAKKYINDNFYFLWNSFLQRLSKMITKSLPQQSFFYIISIEKRRKRFGMKMKMKMKMKMNVEMNSIVAIWYCSIFERSCHKTGMFVDASEENADMDTWENTFIQYYSISISIEIFASRVPWRWRYCKSKQCSNDNFPTFTISFTSHWKWRKIPTNNFISFDIIGTVYLL
jgi:hypothetical protein